MHRRVACALLLVVVVVVAAWLPCAACFTVMTGTACPVPSSDELRSCSGTMGGVVPWRSPCSPGQYCSGWSCFACPRGKYASSYNLRTYCDACPAGHFCDTNTANPASCGRAYRAGGAVVACKADCSHLMFHGVCPRIVSRGVLPCSLPVSLLRPCWLLRLPPSVCLAPASRAASRWHSVGCAHSWPSQVVHGASIRTVSRWVLL